MIWKIAKKEFLQCFRAHKLTVSMLVCCTLMPLSVFVMLLDYDNRYANYAEGRSREALGRYEFAECCGYDNRTTYPDNAGIKKPSKLSIFSKGIENNLSGTFELESNWLEPFFGMRQERNIYASIFGSFDLLLVTKLAIGLLAISLGCTTVVSERESGTLALILSNRIGRFHLITGKILGDIPAVLGPYVCGLTLSLLLIMFWPSWSLGFEELPSTLLIFLILTIYVIFSYLLGVVVSCLCKMTTTASVMAVVVWLITVVLLPLLLLYCAEIAHDVPTIEVSTQQKVDAARAMLEEARPYFSQSGGTTNYGLPIIGGELGEDTMYRQAEIMRNVDEMVIRSERAQINFARSLLALLPCGALTNMVGDLTGTSPEIYPEYKFAGLKVAEAILDRRYPTIDQWIRMFRGSLSPEQFMWGRNESFSNYVERRDLNEEKVMSLLKNPVYDRDSRPLEVSWLWPDYDVTAEAPKYIGSLEPERTLGHVDLISLIAATFICFALSGCLIMKYDVRPS